MKKISKLILILIFFSTCLQAETTTNEVLKILNDGFANWVPIIKSVCLYVFYTLVVIDLAWSFGQLALRGAEFGEIMALLIKKIMLIGIILFLFNADYWLKIIFNSFSNLAIKVTGEFITPNTVIGNAVIIFTTIIGNLSWSIGTSIFRVVVGVIMLIAFVFMAIDLLIVYVKYYLITVVVYFALALGGLEQFKQTALNPIITMIKVGIELFLIQGLMGLLIHTLTNSLTITSKNLDTNQLTEILVLALVFSMITRIVPTVIEAIFSGGLGQNASGAGSFRAMSATAGGMLAGAGALAVGAGAGAIGMTKAMQAAKAQHFAEGGAGGISAVKGTLSNLAQAYKEQQSEAPKGTLGSLAGRMQAKAQTASMDMGSIMDGSAKPSKAKKSSKSAENPSLEAKELSPPKQIPDLSSAGNSPSNETKLDNTEASAEAPKASSEASPISAPTVEQSPSLDSSNNNIEQIKGNSSAQEATLNINQDFNANQAKNSPSSSPSSTNNTNKGGHASQSSQSNIGNIGSSGNINKARNFNADATQGFNQNHSTGPIMDDRAMQDINDALAEASDTNYYDIDPSDPALSNHQETSIPDDFVFPNNSGFEDPIFYEEQDLSDTFYEDTSYHSGVENIHE